MVPLLECLSWCLLFFLTLSVSVCILSSMFKSFFQVFFFLFLPIQGLNVYLLCLQHCRQILYLLSHQGSPLSHISPQMK